MGLVTELGVSSPVVQDGRVVAFFDGWSGGRLFAMDMAGFAVSIQLLKQVGGGGRGRRRGGRRGWRREAMYRGSRLTFTYQIK